MRSISDLAVRCVEQQVGGIRLASLLKYDHGGIGIVAEEIVVAKEIIQVPLGGFARDELLVNIRRGIVLLVFGQLPGFFQRLRRDSPAAAVRRAGNGIGSSWFFYSCRLDDPDRHEAGSRPIMRTRRWP